MGFSVFIFDFDYTLGDSTKGITESVNFALKTMGLKTYTEKRIRETVGMDMPAAFKYLTDIDDKERSAVFYEYFKHKADKVMTKNTILYRDTIPVVSYIKSKGYRTGIVTTKFHYRIDEILCKFSIEKLFDTVIGIDDVKNAKPDPEGLLKSLSILKAAKENVLYIGDTVMDAEAALRANISFCAVTTGTTKKKDFYGFPHIDIISRLSGLLKNNTIL